MKKLTILEAETLAGKFRSEIGLSQYEPVNAKTLLRKLNITTMYRPLSDNSYGISCRSKSGKKFILVNSNSTRDVSISQSLMNCTTCSMMRIRLLIFVRA